MTSPISSMSPYAAGATSNTSNQQNAGAAAGTKSLLDPQAFLQLLVAQLQYQDPSNPADTSTFMNQTAMLSQVQSMNSMQSTLTALASSQQAQTATGMIGKQVTYLDDTGARVSGVVDSAALGATGATLTVGSATVPLASVVGVSAPPAK